MELAPNTFNSVIHDVPVSRLQISRKLFAQILMRTECTLEAPLHWPVAALDFEHTGAGMTAHALSYLLVYCLIIGLAIWLAVHLCIYLTICLDIYLHICLPIYLLVYLLT